MQLSNFVAYLIPCLCTWVNPYHKQNYKVKPHVSFSICNDRCDIVWLYCVYVCNFHISLYDFRWNRNMWCESFPSWLTKKSWTLNCFSTLSKHKLFGLTWMWKMSLACIKENTLVKLILRNSCKFAIATCCKSKTILRCKILHS